MQPIFFPCVVLNRIKLWICWYPHNVHQGEDIMNKMKEMVKNTIRKKMQNQNNVQTKNDAGGENAAKGR